MTKTHITKPNNLKYLGFGFYYNPQTKTWRSIPHKDSVKRFERKLKQLTCRRKNMSFKTRVGQLNPVIRGWINYYANGDMKKIMMKIDAHLRTRLRVILWKQWKVPSGRYHWLRKLESIIIWQDKHHTWGDRYQFVTTKTCVNISNIKTKTNQQWISQLS